MYGIVEWEGRNLCFFTFSILYPHYRHPDRHRYHHHHHHHSPYPRLTPALNKLSSPVLHLFSLRSALLWFSSPQFQLKLFLKLKGERVREKEIGRKFN